MSSFKEKERLKEQQDQFQAILSALLKDEDNKYCVDCDAKGPRWASWNIGIFLCIRCAGIHRNLGVHISKVKSVNLDTWTPEQIAMMQEMGNSRGRAVYEANIPDGFRRPQTDSSLEAFIRSKYEQKKYIAREWIPPQPKIPKEWSDDPKSDKKKTKAKPVTTPLQLTNVPKLASKPSDSTPTGDFAKPVQGPKPEVKVPVKAETLSNSASNDLLGLDLGSPHINTQKAAAPLPSSGNNELLDLFGGPQISQPVNDSVSAPSSSSDLMNGASEGNLFGEDKTTGAGGNPKTSAKDSIMALYGGAGTPSQPQMYGVPAYDDQAINSSVAFSQSQMQPMLSQPGMVVSTPSTQHMSQSSASISALATQQPNFGFGLQIGQTVSNPNSYFDQYQAFCQAPSVQGFQQNTAPFSNTMASPVLPGQFSSPTKQMPDFSNNTSLTNRPQSFDQSMGTNTAWSGHNFAQPTVYGSQGGVYMPQSQPMMPGIQPQQQPMMGMQGIRQPGMLVQQPPGMVMMGQGMMGQPQGMMGNPAINPQMAMYNSPIMGGNAGMYPQQQMQQLQFQQMQQQMTSLKLGGSQMGAVPQQTTGTGGWGNPGPGQTLSTNLWQ